MWLSILLRCLPYLIAGAVGFYGAWEIQGIRVDHKAVEVQALQGELSICQAANDRNKAAISKLRADIKNAYGLCESRLRIKEGLIKKLQDIDGLTPPPGGKKDEAGTSNDPVLDRLNGMF